MAHYAFLNSANVVTNVITGKDETDSTYNWEEYYGNFHNCTVKRTSYNTFQNTHKLNKTPFRGNYAGIGYTYYTDQDLFMPPKPYTSWSMVTADATWTAPITMPTLTEEEISAGKYYSWDEDAYQADNTQGWTLITPE